MKIISREEFFRGINFQHNLSYEMITTLMDQNATFIIKLNTKLKALNKKFFFTNSDGNISNKLLFSSQILSSL